jgi:hypothetical protein
MAFLCFALLAYERALQICQENMFALLRSSQREPAVIMLEEEPQQRAEAA